MSNQEITLKQSMTEMFNLFQYRMDQFQQALQTSSSPAASPNAKLSSEFYLFRTFVLTSLQCLQSQVELLSKLQDDQETRSRRKILLLHGVPETQKEDTTAIVIKVITDRMTVPCLTDNFSRCHRMGRPSSDKPRPIIIKFRDLSIRNKVWFSKSSFKDSGITMSEFLTKSRHDTFMAARKRFGISKCWTRDGYIIVLDRDGKHHKISTDKELDIIPGPIPEGTVPAPITNIENMKQTTVTKDCKTLSNIRPKRTLRK